VIARRVLAVAVVVLASVGVPTASADVSPYAGAIADADPDGSERCQREARHAAPASTDQ